MSSTWNRMRRTIGIAFPMSMGVVALSAGSAWAQTTTLEGSDTLTQVVEQAIVKSGAALTYNNTGSGQGEKNLAATCPAAKISGAHFTQGIAPMSRNVQQAILDNCPTIQPTSANVLGLDAAVFASGGFGGHCQDLTVPHLATDVTTADNTAWPADPRVPNTPFWHQSDLSIVFYGFDPAGPTNLKGTTTQCSAPERISALNRLIACNNNNAISHIYRRDDASGTQDTLREHMQVNYWCNGKSPGNLNNAGSNLLNEDLDPIRRSCVTASATRAATRCTYYPSNETCSGNTTKTITVTNKDGTTTTLNNVPCTQGLIVALSESDPGQPDITLSIANRVNEDGFFGTMGMAGRAMVEQATLSNVAGLTVNTTTFLDANVRGNQYMFSRRLFLEWNTSGTGDSGRDAAEKKLKDYMTQPCNLDPIMRTAGFLSCYDDCTSAKCTDTSNLCCLGLTAGSGIPGQNVGAEISTTATTTDTAREEVAASFCVKDHSQLPSTQTSPPTLCPAIQ